MATVIAFPKRELNSAENKSAKLLGPATIVMFTGVRMERLEDETSLPRPTMQPPDSLLSPTTRMSELAVQGK